MGLSSKKIFSSMNYKKLLIPLLFKEKKEKIQLSVQKISRLLFQKDFNIMKLKSKIKRVL